MGSKAYVRNHRFCDIELMTRDPLRLNHPWKGPCERFSVYIHILRSLSAKQWTMTKCVSAILWCSSRPSFLKGKPPIFKNSGEKEINEALLVWKKRVYVPQKGIFLCIKCQGKMGTLGICKQQKLGGISLRMKRSVLGDACCQILYMHQFFFSFLKIGVIDLKCLTVLSCCIVPDSLLFITL